MKSTRNILMPILLAMALLQSVQTLDSAEVDGTYRWASMSGTLFTEKDEDDYLFYYIDGTLYNVTWLFGDSDFFEKHDYPFPPEGILAAVLGHGVVVRDGTIRTNLTTARSEIVRVARHDPRLAKLVYFNIKTMPKFRRFRRLESGVMYARSRQALSIEVGVETDGGISKAGAWADYRARIVGNKLKIRVDFRGRGGPLGEDRKSYDLSGSARITAVLP